MKIKMNLVNLRLFFGRSDVRIIIFGTATGAILQVLSKRYLKNHPEFLKKLPESDKKIPSVPRGGELLTGSFLAQAILSFLAEHGLTAGLISSVSVIISRVPVRSIIIYLSDAFPQNLPQLNKKKFIMFNGEKRYLDVCDQNMEYLLNVLESESIPFEERQKIARLALTKYLDLTTLSGRINFVLCVAIIFSTLFTKDFSSFHILMNNLIEAIKQGKISKQIARLIVRKLRRDGLPISSELDALVNS